MAHLQSLRRHGRAGHSSSAAREPRSLSALPRPPHVRAGRPQPTAAANARLRPAQCAPSGALAAPTSTTTQQPAQQLGAAVLKWPGIEEHLWEWRGPHRTHRIRYHQASTNRDRPDGTPVILVHGFGGNADHWRKNTAALAALDPTVRVYAIDLLGYGFSDKPNPKAWQQQPGEEGVPGFFSFENFGRQLAAFVEQVVGGQPAFIVCNSVGGVAGLQASVDRPELVRGVQVLNVSLRGLHVQRTEPWKRPLVAWLQDTLRNTQLGQAFFGALAKPQTVKNVLRQAYHRREAVTDELVECILRPGLQPGAVDVFLDFISNSGGPLPEDLMRRTTRPVSIVWGREDPWEDHGLAQKLFAGIPTVEEFVTLPGVGHCPQDEAPELVNPLIQQFVARHSGNGNGNGGSSSA